MTNNSEKPGLDPTRFEIAATEIIDSYEPELRRLLIFIAETSDPDDPEDWERDCCVSDESEVRDFYRYLNPSQEHISVLSEKLGFTVEGGTLMYLVCATMRDRAEGLSG